VGSFSSKDPKKGKQGLQQNTFLGKIQPGIKTAIFYAEFKSVESVANSSLQYISNSQKREDKMRVLSFYYWLAKYLWIKTFFE
jgi:hypothetical protein